MKIFAIQASNKCMSVLSCESDGGLALKNVINSKRLGESWIVPKFEFKTFNKGGKLKPDAAIIGGGFSFRSDLLNSIFPVSCSCLEFLPIEVSDEKWLITNCLCMTKEYDDERSILYRRGQDQIFMIVHIVVNEKLKNNCEIFVLEDSNRSTLLATSNFSERIINFGLTGIQFKEIGFFK